MECELQRTTETRAVEQRHLREKGLHWAAARRWPGWLQSNLKGRHWGRRAGPGLQAALLPDAPLHPSTAKRAWLRLVFLEL